MPEWTACELFEDDRCNTQSKREKDEGLVVPEWTASFDCLDFQEDRREGGLGGYSINLSSHCGGSTSTQMSEILSSGWVRLRSKIRRLNILRIACVNMVGQTHQTKSRDRTRR